MWIKWNKSYVTHGTCRKTCGIFFCFSFTYFFQGFAYFNCMLCTCISKYFGPWLFPPIQFILHSCEQCSYLSLFEWKCVSVDSTMWEEKTWIACEMVKALTRVPNSKYIEMVLSPILSALVYAKSLSNNSCSKNSALTFHFDSALTLPLSNIYCNTCA